MRKKEDAARLPLHISVMQHDHAFLQPRIKHHIVLALSNDARWTLFWGVAI